MTVTSLGKLPALIGSSFTAPTLIVTVSESVAESVSVDRTVNVSVPLKFKLPWYETLANVALMSASEPESVTSLESLAPAEIVAAPESVTFRVPLATES